MKKVETNITGCDEEMSKALETNFEDHKKDYPELDMQRYLMYLATDTIATIQAIRDVLKKSGEQFSVAIGDVNGELYGLDEYFIENRKRKVHLLINLLGANVEANIQ